MKQSALTWIKAKWQNLLFWGGVGSVIVWKVIVPAGNMLIDIHDTIKAEEAFKKRVLNYIVADSTIKSVAWSKLNLTTGKIDIAISSFQSHLQREKMTDDLLKMKDEIIKMQTEQLQEYKKKD